jgi:hypothetical protein
MYSASVQNPSTRSTPARLYQLRVKQYELTRRGQVGDIALEIPLRFFPLSGRTQSDHAAHARI